MVMMVMAVMAMMAIMMVSKGPSKGSSTHHGWPQPLVVPMMMPLVSMVAHC